MNKIIQYLFILISISFLESCSELQERKSNEIDLNICTHQIDTNQETFPSSINPIDESSKDQNLAKQLKKLKNAIDLKDTLLLYSLMDTNIVSSHGGAIYGYDGVIEEWTNKNIWNKLEQVISLGGVFDNDGQEFRLPYCQADKFYGSWNIDWYTTGVTIKPKTLLFSNSDSTSNVIDTLNFSILKTIDYYGYIPLDGMIHIKTIKEDKEGFIKYSDFYGTSDYTLIFEKKENGNWLIISFAPYD